MMLSVRLALIHDTYHRRNNTKQRIIRCLTTTKQQKYDNKHLLCLRKENWQTRNFPRTIMYLKLTPPPAYFSNLPSHKNLRAFKCTFFQTTSHNPPLFLPPPPPPRIQPSKPPIPTTTSKSTPPHRTRTRRKFGPNPTLTLGPQPPASHSLWGASGLAKKK